MIGAAPVASNETPGAVERRAGERPIAQASNRGGRAFRVFATHAVAGPLIGGLIFWLFLFVAAFVEPTQGIARDPAAFREPLCILVDALSAVAAIAALTIPFSFYFGGPPAAAAGLVLALIAWRTGG